jgi:hypothetical protein
MNDAHILFRRGKERSLVYIPLSMAEGLVDVPKRIIARKRILRNHVIGDTHDGLTKHIFSPGTPLVLTRMLGRMYFYIYMNEIRGYAMLYKSILHRSEACPNIRHRDDDDIIPCGKFTDPDN